MDLRQTKLSKAEWETIEQPVAAEQQQILDLIKHGFNDINYSFNNNETLLTFSKLESSDSMEKYVFEIFFQTNITKLYKKYNISRNINIKSKIQPKKKDIIRIENVKKSISHNKDNIYEFCIIKILSKFLEHINSNDERYMKYYYTLTYFYNSTTITMNKFLNEEINFIIESYNTSIDKMRLLCNISNYITTNKYLYKFSNYKLYDHQKEIYSIFKSNNNPKLVFYMAPTGTGKTLTPIGLSEKYKIIFLCAARHIGIALAKSAICAKKKIALAFNCDDSDHIRLHYNAAKEYTRNYKTGGIFRVDNSVGDNVEIIISDIKSYQIAMEYMLAFNKKENIITYWDEPTITMDYATHEFHEIITNNWKANTIPNIVFSSATLPKIELIPNVLADYKERFGGNIITINSNDCNNNIALVTKDGNSVLPHYLYDNYTDFSNSIKHCMEYGTIKRYLDIYEIEKAIALFNENGFIKNKRLNIDIYFPTILDISTMSVKQYYLDICKKFTKEIWQQLNSIPNSQTGTTLYKSSIYITTSDAYTLTGGPTIYLTDEVEKIAKFCFQIAKIPTKIISDIQTIINKNNIINSNINKLEKSYDHIISKHESSEKIPPEAKQLKTEIESLNTRIQSILFPDIYLPNSAEHFEKWCQSINDHNLYKTYSNNVFKSELDEEIIIEIMMLTNINDMWKLLLLMGIGTFSLNHNSKYLEIIKKLAENQKLFLIIASSDYIYGTNYQFCHGYIGKDLINLTQEKIFQAIGRIGRGNRNMIYTVRMRSDEILYKIFTPLNFSQEAINMNKLFITT